MMRSWGPPHRGWQRPAWLALHQWGGTRPAPAPGLVAVSLATATSAAPPAVPSDAEDPADKLRRTEAVLLLSRQPLPFRRLAQLASLADATEARTLVRRLNERYDQRGQAMRVEQVAGGALLLTRHQLAPWLRRLQHLPLAVRLTAPVLETLAIVAYRQPVLRAQIEAIRGAGCGDALRQLMERDLVRISGRSEELGRPYLYSTTNRFLQIFGLYSIEGLPHADWFKEVVANADIESDTDLEKSPSLPDSADKESNVSIRLAAAVLDLDLDARAAADSSVAAGPAVVPMPPSAVEEDDEEFEEEEGDEEFEDEEEYDEEGEEYEDEEYSEEDDEEYEDDEEWEEVEDDEEFEEEDEEGEWDEEEYEEDEEFEEGGEEGEEEEEEEDEWD